MRPPDPVTLLLPAEALGMNPPFHGSFHRVPSRPGAAVRVSSGVELLLDVVASVQR